MGTSRYPVLRTRYMAGVRSKHEPESAANHIGFRCVKSVSQPN